MKKALIDTNIISAFMRDNHQVVEKVKEYLLLHDTLTISAITYYKQQGAAHQTVRMIL